MKVLQNPMEGLYLLQPRVFEDDRGYFFESYQRQRFAEAIGREVTFVQDNESMSAKDVLRGLHFQTPPHAQAKLVRVVHGAVLDVAVDLRKNSPSYGKCFKAKLDAETRCQMFIPEGMAHGFLTLRNHTIFSYKCSDYYAPESEASLRWNDEQLDIDWPLQEPVVSEKDLNAFEFRSFISPF